MKNINYDEFVKLYDLDKNLMLSDKPIIIDFYATWCQPCKMMEKYLLDIKKDYPMIEFFKVDVEDEYKLVEYFKVKNLPTVLFINTNGDIKIDTGTFNKDRISNIIKQHILIHQLA